jgi:hypothetical protein
LFDERSAVPEVFMSLNGEKISGIRVFNIMEEGAAAIEKMVNKAIQEINQQQIKIIDIKVTGDNLVLILGDKEPGA